MAAPAARLPSHDAATSPMARQQTRAGCIHRTGMESEWLRRFADDFFIFISFCHATT
jgi:hypothetical protein